MNDRATTILLVEDNPRDARLLKEMLSEVSGDPFHLKWADRLSAGIEHLARGGIGIVLLDLSLPDSHGLNTLARMQAQAPHLPIIVLTGLNDEDVAVKAVRQGAQDYLIKGQVDANLLTRAARYAIERKRAEEALRNAAQDWRDTFDAIADTVCLLDGEGKVLRCNEAMTTLLGKPFSEIVGRTCWELMHGAPEPLQGCPFVKLRKTQRREALLLPVGERWFNDVVDPLLDEAGNFRGGVHILSDITERKRAEEALRESEEKLRTVLENVNDVVFQLSPSGFIQYVSQNVEELHGHKVKDLIGEHLSKTTPTNEIPKALQALRTVSSGEPIRNFEISQIDGTGEIIPTEINITPVKKGGRVVAVEGVMRDITERKRAEQEKQRLQEQLVQARKMEALGTFAGGIAHEFNNINGEIIAYIDLTLERDDLPGQARRNLEAVRQSAAGGAELTKSLLTFARKDIGEKTPVNLKDVVDEVLRIAEKQLASERIEVAVKHSPSPLLMMGNVHMLGSVVMNLVRNARHAMLKTPVKKLTVQTGVENKRLFIKVEDTGCGIAEENISRVFEPFFTTKGALVSGDVYNGKAHGTGLGLSACHTIVKGHGGEITVNSKVGKGTTFTVYLPPASETVPTHGEAKQKDTSKRFEHSDGL